MKPIRTAAHLMLGTLFITSGARTLVDPDRVVGRAKRVTDRITPMLEAADLPADPKMLIKVNSAVQLAGGLLLASGHFTRPAALALAGTLVPTTLAGHPFWTEKDPQRRTAERVQFAKNMGLLGGLLLAAVDTSGKPGLTWRAGHAAKRTGRIAHRAEHSVRRAARTTRREARLVVKAANLGRRLPAPS
jgi:putative oxidoreductase